MPATPEDRLRRRQACHTVFPGFRALAPAEEFRALAAWCEANDVQHDTYGESRVLQDFERSVAERLGKPAAVLMPSGTMAQLIAVRIWTQRAGLDRFGVHPTSHLLLHEREAYQALLRLHGVPVGDRHRPILAADLEAAHQPLACLLAELPCREIGGQAPDWPALEALKAAAAAAGVPLHMDGARLWECGAFYGRSYAEIAEGFASVYVSTYKGLGGLAGAVLAGDAAFIDEARLWQRRLGGNLVNQTALVASAAMRLEARLASLPACYQRALSLAEGLGALAGVRVNPATPQANMMHVFFDAPAEAVLARRDEIAATDGVWVINDPRPTDTPDWCVTELYVGDTLVDLDDAAVFARFASLLASAGSRNQ
jgi:threonine aldolase